MHDTGRMNAHLHMSRREDDWRRADEWRRLHAKRDVAPSPVAETKPRPRVATLRRLIPGHA